MTTQELLKLFAEKIKDEINCMLPAKVVQVNEDGTVNVTAIRNDEIEDCVVTVPVLRPETQRAYIRLKIAPGDRGVIKFCDRSIENYRQGNEAFNDDNRTHSISDGVFQLGFLPNPEKFIFPDGEITIGLKNKTFTLSVDGSGNLTMGTQNITIKATNTDITSPIKVTGDVSIIGNVAVNGKISATDIISSDTDVLSAGKSGKGHTHTGNMGAPTSAPN